MTDAEDFSPALGGERAAMDAPAAEPAAEAPPESPRFQAEFTTSNGFELGLALGFDVLFGRPVPGAIGRDAAQLGEQLAEVGEIAVQAMTQQLPGAFSALEALAESITRMLEDGASPPPGRTGP